MAMSPFVWGANGQQLTPDQVERLRANATLSSRRGSDASPVGHWSQGLARLIDAYGGYKGNMRADSQETAGLASADAAVQGNPVLSALMGGEQMQAPVAQPGTVAPVAPVGGGLPASIVQTESGGNWNALNSEGYGGRGQFGEARLADAARAGIIPAGMTGAQYSQAPEQTQLAVENWHRNDILKALGGYVGKDVDGPGPIPPLTEDSLLAVAHLGGTGGAKRFVESGGQYNPSDSNGTSLADYAIRHAGGTGAGAVPAGMASSMPQAPSGVVAALASASSNPWVAQKYGPVINALMQQEMGRQDASYQQTLAQSDPMYQAQLQGAQIANQQAMQPQPPEIIEVNGQLINKQTGEIMGDYRTPDAGGSNIPAAFASMDMQAQAAGLVPGTPEYQSFMLNGGAGSGSNVPAAFASMDLQAQAAGFVPGTPEYQNFMATRGAGLAAEATATGRASGEAAAAAPGDYQSGQNALDLIESIRNDPARRRGTGKSSVFNGVPGTAGYDFNLKVEQAKGGAFLTAIQTMKGLGALSNNEGGAATAAVTRMNTAATEEGFLAALDDYEKIVRQGMARAAARGGNPTPTATPNAIAPVADTASPAGIPDGVPADLWAIMTPEEKAAWQ